ncbi:MAG: hypothetical protein JXR94_24690 [Candidatus Hydrogenedentes bacterium]|nr:hypothetical protein [Candidatus Hydrogenedentota bacterium]
MGAILAAVVVGILGAGLYLLSVRSRKQYRCPACGERLSVEHMEAKRCNLCGAPLEKTEGD